MPRVTRRWTVAVLMLVAVMAVPGSARAQGKAANAMPAVSPVLARQIALTRMGFSVGAIDGRSGPKTEKALRVAGGKVEETAEPLQEYVITEEDTAGPFNPSLPQDMMALGALDAVPYADIREMLAERFRSAAALLDRLNPGSTFAAGESIRVPHVDPMPVPALSHMREVADPPSEQTSGVRVSKAQRDLTVVDAAGKVLFYAPVSSGSENDPLPLGEWKVVTVYLRPIFNYNPELFWDADASHAKATIQGGPNNPVGLTWIDIDKEHYGLHGTPTPETIGITQSHGCVRLTNWDALHLATLVKPGTPILFVP